MTFLSAGLRWLALFGLALVKPSTYTETHKSELELEFKQECYERTFGQWNVPVYNVQLTEPEVRPVLFVTSELRTQQNLQVKTARNATARYRIFSATGRLRLILVLEVN